MVSKGKRRRSHSVLRGDTGNIKGQGEDRKKSSDQRGANNKQLVAYTNINGLISGLTELNHYLREVKPDVMGIVETKLKGHLPPDSIGEG